MDQLELPPTTPGGSAQSSEINRVFDRPVFESSDTKFKLIFNLLSRPEEERAKKEMDHMAIIVKDLPFFKERNMSESTLLEVLNVMKLLNTKRR